MVNQIIAQVSPVRCCVTTRKPGSQVSLLRPILRLEVRDLQVFWEWQSGLADGDLYVSDFANDIRRYNLKSGELVKVLSTNYTDTSPSSNFLGNLAFSPIGNLFVVGFDNRANANGAGAVSRYNGKTNEPLPISGNPGSSNSSIFVPPDSKLQRPIGIAFFPSDAQLTQKWNFTLANYPINHQGLNNLNIDVNYKYKDGIQNYQYPDYVPIYKSIENFLVNYPNETDFWEIVNKNLTEKVLADNPAISSLTVNLDVLPTNRLPYERSSTVTRTQDGKLGEAWNFKIPNYSIAHQGLNNLNIDVKYQYKPRITQDEYPDFVPIYTSIDNFLTNYPNETDFWEILNKSLTNSARPKIRLWIPCKLIWKFCRLIDYLTIELVLCRSLSL